MEKFARIIQVPIICEPDLFTLENTAKTPGISVMVQGLGNFAFRVLTLQVIALPLLILVYNVLQWRWMASSNCWRLSLQSSRE